jgi:hypothetical protein
VTRLFTISTDVGNKDIKRNSCWDAKASDAHGADNLLLAWSPARTLLTFMVSNTIRWQLVKLKMKMWPERRSIALVVPRRHGPTWDVLKDAWSCQKCC